MQHSTVALLTAIVVGFFVFALGYVYAMFQKARGSYKSAKGGVPKARTSYFASLWLLIKWGAGAVLIAAVLLTWTANDVADAGNTEPSPSPSATARR